jgi:hypothetical protein
VITRLGAATKLLASRLRVRDVHDRVSISSRPDGVASTRSSPPAVTIE